MTIDLRRASSSGEVSGARPKVDQDGDPAGPLAVRARRLALLGGSVMAVGLLIASLAFDDSTVQPKAQTDSASPRESSQPAASSLADYAFALPELDGLPPNVPPGTSIEVWVTWEPPVTKKLKVQQLVPEATVDKLIPSIDGGPPTVMLSLERRYIPDLMYGDRFGALSTVLVAGSD